MLLFFFVVVSLSNLQSQTISLHKKAINRKRHSGIICVSVDLATIVNETRNMMKKKTLLKWLCITWHVQERDENLRFKYLHLRFFFFSFRFVCAMLCLCYEWNWMVCFIGFQVNLYSNFMVKAFFDRDYFNWCALECVR